MRNSLTSPWLRRPRWDTDEVGKSTGSSEIPAQRGADTLKRNGLVGFKATGDSAWSTGSEPAQTYQERDQEATPVNVSFHLVSPRALDSAGLCEAMATSTDHQPSL
ncbi:hypothetical protein MRX96_058041 [Rhipicephalus microplus]